MKSTTMVPHSGAGWARVALLCTLLLALLLAGRATRAQNAPPTFAGASSGNNFQPTTGNSQARATATDPATGNVYVTGFFNGPVTFGSTRLVSMGNSDVFVAKWDAAAQAWTSAVSGGGTSTDQGLSVAVSSAGAVASVYVTGYYNGSATLAGTALTPAGGNDVFVAKYTDSGTGLSTINGGAVSGGGGSDQGNGVAVAGSTVYVGAQVGSVVAGFGSSPVRRAPINSAVLARLDAGTLGYQGIEGPLQGGNSYTQAVATDPATGNGYVTGYFTGTVAFGSTRLVSAGSNDVFVAKWDAAAQAWTSAVSGGGTSDDRGYGIAVGSTGGVASVYVTGYYTTSATLAGTALTSAGGSDVFVAKYTDPGTGLTNGGAMSGGGGSTGGDQGNGIAVSSAGGVASVYVTGYYTSSATIAGTTLIAVGSSSDVFVAKYTDPGTGLTSTDGGAVGGGGTGTDQGNGVALAGQRVYVAGYVVPSATFGSTTLANPAGGTINVLARVVDATLTPLPVQLVQFAAAPAGPAAVRLAWATASEQNSRAFEVERSTDGRAFIRIGTVAAAGSTTTRRAYTYHDATAPAGPSYYRLRQLDLDGTSAYSPVRAVTLGGASLALYPNPAAGGAATLTGTAPGQGVRVFDALGRLATTATADATGTAALSGLAPGLYLVRVGAATVRLAVAQAW
jgi:hypothetical protein